MSRILDAKKALAKTYKLAMPELFPALDGSALDIDAIAAPCATINALTGVGGFPRGRITEIYGPESCGKTTLGIEIIAAAQKDPEAVALFLDFEHAFEPSYALRLGTNLDPESFIFAQPDTMEQGTAILDYFVSEGLVDVAVIDSIEAMNPRTFQEGEMDKGREEGKSKVGQVGLKAQLMSRWLNRLKSQLSSGRKPAIICLNQQRTKINVRFGTSSQAPTGGNALKYYASVRIELDRAVGEGEEGRSTTKALDQKHQQVRVRMTCVKNKVGPPWRRSAMVIRFGTGISNVESVADLADMYLRLRKPKSSWYVYEGDTEETSFKVQGREQFIQRIQSCRETLNELEEKALKKLEEVTQALPDEADQHDLIEPDPEEFELELTADPEDLKSSIPTD